MPPHTVEHLSCRFDDWYEQTQQWLAKRKLTFLEIKLGPDGNWPMSEPPDGMLAIATGKRTSDGVAHAAVVRIGIDEKRMWFETVFAPDEGELSGVESLTFFPKLQF